MGHRKRNLVIKYEFHLPIFAHWWGYRKRFGETLFSNKPEGLLCAFTLIENMETFNHVVATFSKSIIWSVGYNHSFQLRNSLCSPIVTIFFTHFSIRLPYPRQDEFQIQSEHHTELSVTHAFCVLITRQLHLWQHVDFLLQSEQTSAWSSEGPVYYFETDLLALSKPLSFPFRVHAFSMLYNPTASIIKPQRRIQM